MASSKTNKNKKVVKWFVKQSAAKRFALYLLIFGIVGGGILTYRSFALTPSQGYEYWGVDLTYKDQYIFAHCLQGNGGKTYRIRTLISNETVDPVSFVARTTYTPNGQVQSTQFLGTWGRLETKSLRTPIIGTEGGSFEVWTASLTANGGYNLLQRIDAGRLLPGGFQNCSQAGYI